MAHCEAEAGGLGPCSAECGFGEFFCGAHWQAHDERAYRRFLASKRFAAPSVGQTVAAGALHSDLLLFQRDLTAWALQKGRAALFTPPGSGKTFMQLEWARQTGEQALIVAPLAVALQTAEEAQRWGYEAVYLRQPRALPKQVITITNYEMRHHFDPALYRAVVLDESSILKNFSGTTKRDLIRAFRDTPLRLACTATPSPNDTVELCNHADFLSVMSPADMLTTFFISKGDDQKDSRFRLKGHARAAFFRWLASWAMAFTLPSDLGYEDGAFALPPLYVEPIIVPTNYVAPGYLLQAGLNGIQDRAAVRKGTLAERVARCAEIVEREPDEQRIIWCGLNDEGRELARLIPVPDADKVNLEGSESPERKEAVLSAFARGDLQVLITKSRIAGYGMNFQACARMTFCGLSDSFEDFYQSLCRCHRFGQSREVRAEVVLSELEIDVLNNVLRKQAEHEAVTRELVANVRAFERAEIGAAEVERDAFEPAEAVVLPDWLKPIQALVVAA